ncbi:MAG: trigger factor [Patescibacteria group bacterium]|mgnify:CR=1 FL=1
MKTNLKKLPKSQMEIGFELTAEEFQKHINHALLYLKEHVKIDGFRQGQAPLKMVKERIGQENLLMEAGDLAVKETYLKYIGENKLEPIGEPEVQILKIVPTESRIHDGETIGTEGNPFLFKVVITILPEIQLPDYKDIASKIIRQSAKKEISVADAEIEDALNYLQKSRAKFSQIDKEAEKKDFVEIEYQSKDINNNEAVKDRFILGEGGLMKGFEDNVVGMKAGQEKEFSVKFPDNASRKDLAGKDIIFKVRTVSVQKMELPEINDEFAKQLGEFDSLVALKSNIKEGLIVEKKEGEKQRQRGEILEKIAEKIDFEISEKLVDSEQQRLLEDLKNNISGKFKISFEEYLSSVKQTEEEIKKTFAKEAEKRIKNFLVLKEIGKKEGIRAEEDEVEEELNKTIKIYSTEQLAKIDIGQFREYTKDVIYNEKVFQKLESFTK